MRIATWNLNRPFETDSSNAARLRRIEEIGGDIWILTETHALIQLGNGFHSVCTGPSARKPRPGESCAAIHSRWPILRTLPTSDPTEAVCAEIACPTRKLLVYGSIIAYHGYRGPDKDSACWQEHYRFIEWHRTDWLRLRKEFPEHVLITAGDYNQARDGAGTYGTAEGRAKLTSAFSECGLSCVTEEDFVRTGKLRQRHTVDHICLPRDLRVTRVGAWENTDGDGQALSDHNGIRRH